MMDFSPGVTAAEIPPMADRTFLWVYDTLKANKQYRDPFCEWILEKERVLWCDVDKAIRTALELNRHQVFRLWYGFHNIEDEMTWQVAIREAHELYMKGW